MKLSFSTRGWRNLFWQQQVDNAMDFRFGGIEVYDIMRTDSLTDKGCPFHKYNVGATMR